MAEEKQASGAETAHGPIAWMARNAVAANLLMFLFLIGGLIIAGNVKQEVFPEFTTDIIRISVPYPGASPEEVEQGIILSIEDAVRGLEGVKRVTSIAGEGVGTLVVELIETANEMKLLQDVKNEVDRIQSFPEDAERPIVSLVENRRRVVALLVHGSDSRLEIRKLADRIREELPQEEGITLVELGLTPQLEISIEIPLATLRSLNLRLEDIAALVGRSALELPGGEIKTEGGQILLRADERRDFGREFLDIPVASNPDGSRISLADIATIKDGFEQSDQEASLNGNPAVYVNVYRVGDETPQQVSASVKAYIERIQKELPEGISLTIWDDNSENYRDRIWLLQKNALLGLCLVLIGLGLFLEPKLAFWVTLGIPISILGSFLFFPFTGASINMISLFAFIVTLGIIVDDAVVVGESIYDKRERGMRAIDAAISGVKEVGMPVVFAVLTNIIAFLPLFFVPGISGKFFRQIPSVTVCVFIVSLIESLFILPAHLAHVRRKRKEQQSSIIPSAIRNKASSTIQAANNLSHQASDFLDQVVKHRYAPFINKAVKYRYITMSTALAVLILAVGLVIGGHVRFSFLPRIDGDNVIAQATLPFGSPFSDSKRIEKELIQAARNVLQERPEDPLAKGIYTQIGGSLVSRGPGPSMGGQSGSHVIAAEVALVAPEDREITATEFARAWRNELGKLAGVESLVFKSDTGAREGAAIEFNLSHRSRETLDKAAIELRLALESYAGVTDTDDGVADGKRQLNFEVTPLAQSFGLTASEVGRQVRAAFYGAEALRQQRGRDEVRVYVRLPESERTKLSTLDDFTIQTANGDELPFGDAAHVEESRSYTEIQRLDGRRVSKVTAEVDSSKGNANEITQALVEKELAELLRKYPGLSYSFGGEQEAQRDSVAAIGRGSLVALICIYALLAIPFKSYSQPLIVMLSIPFGIIGAIGGHFLLGYGLSIISLFGIIALAGVVVNDSLVLVVTANRYRSAGAHALEAVALAGVRRFRPILLTSVTTFFGLAPMIFETSMQARFLIPMAISIGFGILFSTVIILVIVPAGYVILEDISNLFLGTEEEDPTPEARK